ncbi:MAG: ATP-grasp fold amidoligase family protein [Anaerocolumna sp.]
MNIDNVKKNIILTPFNLLYKISPELNIKILFWLKCRYKLNLKNPVTYNEKLQWIKFYNKNPLMPKCCDKYTVREYVESKGCGAILNVLIWEGFNPGDIPFDSLPERFVIKVTHGSTFNIICTDKSKLNQQDVIANCKKWLKVKFLPCYGEWFYGIEKPRIIIEGYLDNGNDGLRDYKVYCFNGIPRYISVDSGRGTGEHFKDIYDTGWNLQYGFEMAYKCTNEPERKPDCLNELLTYAKILSEDFLHARVDFYIVNAKIIFGEITFTNSAGFGTVSPYEFAKSMGDYLKLPL